MKTRENTAHSQRQLKETRVHGNHLFPCAYYYANDKEQPFDLKAHWHDSMEIVHLIKGEYDFMCDLFQKTITEEAFCFINKESLHRIYAEADYEEEAFVFHDSILESKLEDASQTMLIRPIMRQEITFPVLVEKGDPAFEAIARDFSMIATTFQKNHIRHGDQYIISNPVAELRVKATLISMIATLQEEKLLQSYNAKSSQIGLLKDVLSYMEKHYAEKIYLKDMAELAGMNEQYFSRIFKKYIGQSPFEYLSEYRVKKACVLLSESNDLILEIAMECGFHNLGHFNQTFKRITGMTPLYYRKSIQTMKGQQA